MALGYATHTAKIRGVVPTIMHNGRTSNPLDPMAKMMKGITKKRNKTDDDFAVLAKMEWYAGLYLESLANVHFVNGAFTILETSKPTYPAENIEAMLLSAAKKLRLGQLIQTGVICDEVFPLEFEGYTTLENMWNSGNFADSRKVKIQKNSVIRCRPIFREWELKVSINYLPDIIDEQQVADILVLAGRLVGLSDYRPKYGRFTVLD
jgi:hypothetical protein